MYENQIWTNEDIEAIMVQLNNQNLPFAKYEFSDLGKGLQLLGSGASGNVYRAYSKEHIGLGHAIKVIGFGKSHVDSEAFRDSVGTQLSLGLASDHILKIYEYVELRVWIKGEHEVEKVEKINPYEDTKPEGDFLHLQFILMESQFSVLKTFRLKHVLFPMELRKFDENEIFKLANEIGIAIDKAHKENLLHRDIKLENLFYDLHEECYKLGDFGIARTTDDGLASTVAFTKGYGAPEVVGTIDDKYDYTADIYSFGMMLYVLLNELRFPGSNDYRPTIYQYTKGYIPPEPANGSDEFVKIVLKMISFNPDDRYQTMDEVLNEFDKIKFGYRLKYQREHKNTAISLGTAFALTGALVGEMAFAPTIFSDFSRWMYVLCILCIGQSVLYIFHKNTQIISLITDVLWICIMFASGFTWWKLVVLIIFIFADYLSGILGGCALIANATSWLMRGNELDVSFFVTNRWLPVLLISLAAALLLLHFLLSERDNKITKSYYGKNKFWMTVIAFYILLVIIDYSVTMNNNLLSVIYLKVFGESAVDLLRSCDLRFAGAGGIIFSLMWMFRENILIFIERRREKV